MPRSASTIRRVACASAAALLLAPAGATAAQRYTTADAGATSGSCAVDAPCRIDVAVGKAAAGDEVIVAPGTYDLSAPLAPTVAIDLHGAAGQARPRLVDSDGTAAMLDFRAGGTVSHLRLDASGPGQDAITLQGGVADDLLLTSATGDGGKLVGAASTTVLRDSVVRTASATSGDAALKLRTSGAAGDIALRNVTALGPNMIGVRCDITGGRATMVNAIARGATADVDATKGGANCSASSSSLRAAMSPGLAAGTGNQEAAPVFVDVANGDYREAAGSPTIDAGTGDPLLGGADPAGCARTLGLAPDIGAYEEPACGTAVAEPLGALPAPGPGSAGNSGGDDQGEDTGGDDTADDTPPSVIHDIIKGIPAPVQGKTVVVAVGKGKVLVRKPGSTRFHQLVDPRHVPVGSVFDATRGRVKLVSAVDAAGHLQLGTFWGSRFQVRQSKGGSGRTELILRGGNWSACHPASASHTVATVSRKRHRRVRSLWGSDSHGRYRTHGVNSAATARGTKWLTEDRCDGTLTRVVSGSVAVRDHRRHRTVVVKAGHRYLARAHG